MKTKATASSAWKVYRAHSQMRCCKERLPGVSLCSCVCRPVQDLGVERSLNERRYTWCKLAKMEVKPMSQTRLFADEQIIKCLVMNTTLVCLHQLAARMAGISRTATSASANRYLEFNKRASIRAWLCAWEKFSTFGRRDYRYRR